jgi:hypothetical protein
MRSVVISVCSLLLIAGNAFGQVWEKYLAPGLTYRMEVDSDLPRTIHALRFDIHSDAVHASAELGEGKVYNDDKTKGRESVSGMVNRFGAIAGINASYFPYTGRPVGLMVHDSELISSPYKNRPEFGWGLGQTPRIATSNFSSSFKSGEDNPVSIDTINEEAKVDSVAFDTDTGAFALAKVAGTCAVIRVAGDKLPPDGTLEGEVVETDTNVVKMAIPKGEAVLVGTGIKADSVAQLKPGNRVSITVHVDGFNWDKVTNVVCGGPVLLRGGQPVDDWQEEGFTQSFALRRYARTAVGVDQQGNVWLVSVDGTQQQSVGATLDEMAAIMRRFGCWEAMNLDGGGSTTMNSYGVTVNRPADGVEREVANAILFYGPPVTKDSSPLTMQAPAKVKLGDKVQIAIGRADGARVPDSEVFWSASGGGWIDQGGLLHADKAASITVYAYVHGQILNATVTVDSASADH